MKKTSTSKKPVIWNGVRCSLGHVAREEGLEFRSLRTVWYAAGAPERITKELLLHVDKQKKRQHTEGYTVDGVHYSSLEKVAIAIDRSSAFVMNRFRALGKTECTRDEMVNTIRRAVTEVLVEGEEHKRAVGSLYKLWPDLNRGPAFFRQVWVRLGEPAVVTKRMFADESAKSDGMRRKTLTTCPEYTNPAYLPHVKHGDLVHLSDKENTGAGAGEIAHEKWVGRIGRAQSIGATTRSINLTAFNR